MKTITLLLKVLANYIANKCFRKLISQRPMSGESAMKYLMDADIDVLMITHHMEDSSSKKQECIFGRNKQKYIEDYYASWVHQNKYPDLFERTFILQRHQLNSKLILNALEVTRKVSTSAGRPLIYISQFAWVELVTKN